MFKYHILKAYLGLDDNFSAIFFFLFFLISGQGKYLYALENNFTEQFFRQNIFGTFNNIFLWNRAKKKENVLCYLATLTVNKNIVHKDEHGSENENQRAYRMTIKNTLNDHKD